MTTGSLGPAHVQLQLQLQQWQQQRQQQKQMCLYIVTKLTLITRSPGLCGKRKYAKQLVAATPATTEAATAAATAAAAEGVYCKNNYI